MSSVTVCQVMWYPETTTIFRAQTYEGYIDREPCLSAQEQCFCIGCPKLHWPVQQPHHIANSCIVCYSLAPSVSSFQFILRAYFPHMNYLIFYFFPRMNLILLLSASVSTLLVSLCLFPLSVLTGIHSCPQNICESISPSRPSMKLLTKPSASTFL